jgi:hypothetical protein
MRQAVEAMAAAAPLGGLHELPLAVFIRTSHYVYPLLEAVHITGIAMLLGTLLLVDLRILGAGRALPAPQLARYALPWSIGGFAVLAASGSLMFLSRIGEFVANPVFVWKFGLITLAAVNAAALHLRGGVARRDAAAKAQALLSLGLWLAVVACGRMIAYV